MPTEARRIAAEVLLRVAQGGAFANLALDAALRQAGILEPREAALATELCYGTLRWQLQLDRAIEAHSDRAIADLEEPVKVALRLGAFELLHHPRVPARAAVNEAVELSKELKAARASGFVNAVLRRLAETRAPPEPPSAGADPERDLHRLLQAGQRAVAVRLDGSIELELPAERPVAELRRQRRLARLEDSRLPERRVQGQVREGAALRDAEQDLGRDPARLGRHSAPPLQGKRRSRSRQARPIARGRNAQQKPEPEEPPGRDLAPLAREFKHDREGAALISLDPGGCIP